MNDKAMTFGSNLKALRKKRGYTRAQLAETLCYSEKTIEKWEFGNTLPAIENLCRLADFFGVTLDSLVYSTIPKIKYLLGIDGGGSKTEFLLTDTDKNEIARVVLGPSNPGDVGMENVKNILEQGIHTVCNGIRLCEVSLFAGLAGGGISGDNRRLINGYLSCFNFGAFSNGSDAENVLEMSLGGEDGVVVIMGTGVIAFALSNGKRHRIGGWGYHIDKGGSGYNFATEAIYSALKYTDGRNGSAILNELFEKELGKPLTEAIHDIHTRGRGYIASFAPLVFEAYAKGDKYAELIIDANIREVSEMILAGKKQLPHSCRKVVICGGLCNRPDIFEHFFKYHLGSELDISFNNDPVVNGAVMLAGKLKNEAENINK